MLTQFGCKRLKSCDLEQGFFLLGEQVYALLGEQFCSMTKTFFYVDLEGSAFPKYHFTR